MAKKIIVEEVLSEEYRVFRINVGTIPTGEVESYLTNIKSKFKKKPIMQVPQNLYKRTLITEKVEKFAPLTYQVDYFIPLR